MLHGSCLRENYKNGVVLGFTSPTRQWSTHGHTGLELYAPALVVQRKWHTATRNLCPGDVVIVADKNTLRGDYRLALVQDVFPGEDGKVRKVTVKYKSYRTGEKVHEYRGARDTVVSRAVQRLALVVPVD